MLFTKFAVIIDVRRSPGHLRKLGRLQPAVSRKLKYDAEVNESPLELSIRQSVRLLGYIFNKVPIVTLHGVGRWVGW